MVSWKNSWEFKAQLAEARQAATMALEEAGITGMHACPYAACEALGVSVVPEADADEPLPPGVVGSTEYLGNDFRIVIGSAGNFGFTNFTLAHELGHICIGSHQPLITGSRPHYSGEGFLSASKGWEERQADHFAASFLMPEKPCRDFVDGMPDEDAGLKAIELLQGECNVSLTSAAIRYAELTSHLAAVVVSTDGVVDYCIRSKDLIDQVGYMEFLKKGSKLPKYTKSHKMSKDPVAIQAADTEECEGRWNTWFGTDNGEIFEEVRGLGKYGKVLTVLTSNDQ
jgi:hypothetical protein